MQIFWTEPLHTDIDFGRKHGRLVSMGKDIKIKQSVHRFKAALK